MILTAASFLISLLEEFIDLSMLLGLEFGKNLSDLGLWIETIDVLGRHSFLVSLVAMDSF